MRGIGENRCQVLGVRFQVLGSRCQTMRVLTGKSVVLGSARRKFDK